MTDIISTSLNPSKLAKAVRSMCEARQPVFTWGAPGIGKSQIHEQVANDMGVAFLDLRAVLLDVVDLRGLPHVNGDGRAHWAIPEFLPQNGEGILFLDEFQQAVPLVKNGLSSLILDRRLGEYRLPDGWAIAAASNRESDRASTTKMPTHIANRFVHLDLEIDTQDWRRWGATTGLIRPEVLAFIAWRPELLHQFDPRSDSKAFASPRSWQFASRIMDTTPTSDVELALYAGALGTSTATEFVGFCRVFRDLPNIDAIIMDPKNGPVPEKPDVLYALCGSLAMRADDNNVERIYEYADRLNDEFTVLLMRDLIARNPELQNSKAFIQFGAKYAGVVI